VSKPKIFKRIVLGCLAVILLTAAGVVTIRQQGNFHTVADGKVYRSGQLSEKQLSKYIEKYRVQSILNLRGRNEKADWWVNEVNLAERLGVSHYDVALSSKKQPGPEQFQEILCILQTAPKPLLIHCEAGADRSGLVSAVYLLEFEGYSYQKARRQLSFIYGHIPLLRPKTRAMDQALEEFETALKLLFEMPAAGAPLPAYR